MFRHISGDNFQFVIFTVASEGLKYGLDNVENCREHIQFQVTESIKIDIFVDFED